MLPSHFNTAAENTDDFTPGNQTEASSSSCWKPGLSSLTSSSCQSPTSEAKRGFQIPKLARLHQQVTQFKLLKLAQNQGAQSWYSSPRCLCLLVRQLQTLCVLFSERPCCIIRGLNRCERDDEWFSCVTVWKRENFLFLSRRKIINMNVALLMNPLSSWMMSREKMCIKNRIRYFWDTS